MYRGSSLILSSYSSGETKNGRTEKKGDRSGERAGDRWERHLIPVCLPNALTRRLGETSATDPGDDDGGIEQNEMNPLSPPLYRNNAVGANLKFEFMQQYVWGFWNRGHEKSMTLYDVSVQ